MRSPTASRHGHLASLVWIAAWAVVVGCGSPTANSSRADADSKKSAGRDTARTEIERGPVKVTVEVSPAPARLSDEPVLTLSIAAEQGVEVHKPPFGDAVGDFVIRDFHEPLPEVQGNREVIHQVYQLEPTVSGPAQIDPIVIQFVDKRPQGDGKSHQLETEALTIQILSTVEKSAPTLADLKNYDTPVPLRSNWNWWWLAGSLFLVVIAGGIWWRRSRRRVAPVIELSPREQAQRELETLWSTGLAQRDVKVFYVELTGIVRRYIERTTQIQAPEQTTEEFLRVISSSSVFSREERMRLGDFLEAADLVKFARHQPAGGDIEESYRRARSFVGGDAREVAA